MEIIYDENPPNYKKIAKTFKIKGRTNIVFTYGDKLYVPGGEGITIDPHLLRHEETHTRQQADMGVDKWWKRYLKDPAWRFMQELEAYRNQYRSMDVLPLPVRMRYLDHIATDLSGEMYGNLVTKEEALMAITNGINLKSPRVFVHRKKGVTKRQQNKRERQNRKKGRK